jgi:uncharacterized protein (TIGR03790 family)
VRRRAACLMRRVGRGLRSSLLTVTMGSAIAAASAADTARAVSLSAGHLAVVINTAEPLSVEIGEYYVRQRHIPRRNVSRVAFDGKAAVLSAAEFSRLKAAIDAQLPPDIRGYALTWVTPYRVECMSMTSAFALGFDPAYCAERCALTRVSPYFDAATLTPVDPPSAPRPVRVAMAVAALSFAQAKLLIDRGVAADGTAPRGTAYLVTTGDAHRDVRAAGYAEAAAAVARRLRVQLLQADAVRDRPDVMFYFIGAAQVPALQSNRFLPGAVADHLTSGGGVLVGGDQMSSLRWLEAGATASYGAVVEPCNFTTKFPNPALLMTHYLAGETLIEAYWKSVAMPGQGLFIGEPLARPFGSRPRSAH